MVPREICLLIVALGIIRIYITFVVNVLLARRAVPRIVGEVSIALSLVVFTLVRLDAVGVNLTSIIATTAVGGAAIAFAMQSTLGNLLGGISLQLDNTCRIGDWIEIEGVTGEVVGIRWRYTALATVNNVTIIIPNASLMNNRVTLLGRRGDQRIPWRRPIEFMVGYEWTPGQVMAVVIAALERVDIPFVAAEPAVNLHLRRFRQQRHQVHRLLLADRYQAVHGDGLARAGARVRRTGSRRHGHPHLAVGCLPPFGAQQACKPIDRGAGISGWRCCNRSNLFASLTDEETQALAAQLIPTPLALGDVATKQGEPSESLYILARGQVGIFRDSGDANPPRRQRLATLPAPQYFGEMGLLTGQARTATILAESEVLCYRLDKSGFEAIIRARPEIADAMSQTVVARQAANDATLASLSADARARAAGIARQRPRPPHSRLLRPLASLAANARDEIVALQQEHVVVFRPGAEPGKRQPRDTPPPWRPGCDRPRPAAGHAG